MTLYLDTSVVVSALVNEPDTLKTQAWLVEHQADGLAISDWVVTEFSSALSLKLRTRDLSEGQRDEAAALFGKLVADTFERLPVSRSHFETAAQFADRHDSGLRGGDALHLAICADKGLTLCTLDRRLHAAGTMLGVATQLL